MLFIESPTLGRERIPASLDPRLYGLGRTSTTSSTQASHEPLAEQQPQEPLALRQLRECAERGFADSTEYSGTRSNWKPGWSFEFIGDAIILNSLLDQFLVTIEPWPLPRVAPATDPHLEAVRWIKASTGLPFEAVGRLIGVTRQTLSLWERRKGGITPVHRRRILAVKDVLERAASRHPTPEALSAWLNTPHGPDVLTPTDLLAAGEIDRARFYAVTRQPSSARQRPEWASRQAPEAFRSGGERRQEPLRATEEPEISMLARQEWGSDDEATESATNE